MLAHCVPAHGPVRSVSPVTVYVSAAAGAANASDARRLASRNPPVAHGRYRLAFAR